MISRAERGEAPSPSVIDALAEVLEVYPEFFANEPRAQLFDEDVHFRRRAAARVVDRQQALAHSSLFGEFLCSLEEHVDLPMDVVPTITARSPAEIEGAAAATRAAFGLPPNDRLENVVRVLENAGIVVALPRGYVDEVDAFSAGPPSVRKIVILNANDPASRTVFNAAHELGHLVLHAGRPTGDKASEAEADAFASSFLMPRQGISREFPRGRVDWRELFRLKERWHVSVAALLRRGKDLGHISQVDYLGARKYISSKGWNKKEPGEFTTPRPELVQKAVLVVHEHCNLTFFDLASAQHLQPSVLGFITGVPIPEPPAANSVIALASRRPNGSGVFDTD